MPRQNGYSRLQIGLHWAVALLIVAAFFTHEEMGQALRARLTQGAVAVPLHVWFGVSALILIVIRSVVRAVKGVPPQPAGSSRRAAKAAEWGHRLLYILMLATPVLGGMAWYGGLAAAGEVHEIVGKALMILALGHAGVALAHATIRKDGVLQRMFRPAP